MKMQHRITVSRRTVIVVLFLAGLLAIGGYILWSGSAWANYHTTYSQSKDDIKNKIGSALGMPATTTSERVKKLEALEAASEAITSTDRSLCDMNGVVSWQQSVNATYKKWQQECLTTQSSEEALGTPLASAVSYLQAEHKLAGVLSTALHATDKKVTESTLSTVLAKWTSASADVRSLEVSAEFTPVKAKAQKAVDGVTSAWQALIAAHAAKDESKYNKALTGLTSAYSAIDDIEKQSVTEFTALSSSIDSAYKAM